MKKLYTFLIAALIAVNIFAQAPNMLSYQAVIRNSSNQLVTGKTVGIRVSILQGSSTGTPVYVETQTPTTNSNGLITIRIGGGTVVSGDFAAINWAEQSFYLKTETDPNGGTNYTITGASQILSVPYALYASKAGQYSELDPIFNSKFDLTGAATNDILRYNGVKWEKFTPNYLTTEVDGSVTNELELPTNATAGDMAYFNGANWVSVPKGADGQVLSIQSGIPQWKSSQAANLNPPTVVTGQPIVKIVGHEAFITFTGTVNPNGLETIGYFDVWTSSGYTRLTSNVRFDNMYQPYFGFENIGVEINASGDGLWVVLSDAQEVQYRFKAYNSSGMSYGEIQSLSLPCLKPIINYISDYVTSSTAEISVSNYAQGNISATLEWGTSQSYGNTASLNFELGLHYTKTLENLSEGTTYHYRCVFANSCGTTYSEDKTFTTYRTTPAPPQSITKDAFLISKSSAKIYGSVNPNNLITSVVFEYGLTTSYGNELNILGGTLSGYALQSVLTDITGLTPGTTYHYRVKAENSSGISYGEDRTFTTHTYAIGDNVFGGIVVSIDNAGEHGLVCAPTDQSSGVAWSNGNFIITGAKSLDGQLNTAMIVSKQGEGSYAAKICDDLIFNGYDDWYLPSDRELGEMIYNMNKAGLWDGTYSSEYWSSTEFDEFQAIIGRDKSLEWSSSPYFPKNTLKKVRAVRRF